MILYTSTRGGDSPRTFEDVLLSGLAPDGGLYMPQSWPTLDLDNLRALPYPEAAASIMFPFVEGTFEYEEFRQIVHDTYNTSTFKHPKIVPLHKLYPHIWTLELFHGPTIAFKDVALQLLGKLFDHVLKKQNRRMTIIGATSGDTGSAAIEGCKDCQNAEIFILHPAGRVSDVQRRQMTTVHAPNVHNLAIEGTFDDCQALVKAMFNDQSFRTEMALGAINSINWARIMAQIVYYVTSALELGAPDNKISYVVPTGNFGNVFAAWCARQMGLPIHTLAIATNKNDILTRFFETGTMKTDRVIPTISPSMDIQISSNFERYLFELLLRNTHDVQTFMNTFLETGETRLDSSLVDHARSEFRAFRATDQETNNMIERVYEDTEYMLDPHTAVGMNAAKKLATEDHTHVVSLACAHPAKFPDAVTDATGVHPDLPDHLKKLMTLEEQFTTLPNDLNTVQSFIRKQKQ